MHILYLGYFCKEATFNALVEHGSNGSHARQQLEKKLLDGLIEARGGDTIDIISYLPEIEEVHKSAGEGEVYQGLEITYLWCKKNKIISVLSSLKKNMRLIKAWVKGKEEKVILTYSVNPLHVIPALLLRRKCGFKVVTLCSEVSVYRRKGRFHLAGQISRKISSCLDNSFDGYILLSKYMNEIVNQRKQPYMVMEGVAQEYPRTEKMKKTLAVMYAGGLTQDNGIEILLEGFCKLAHPKAELWICGDGPLKECVEGYAQKHENIHYYGIWPNDEVQRMEQEAAVLIAPRFSKNDFTKYSFPSKTIEYMTSGTPAILTRLKGIPEEYFDYAYILEDETAEGICNLLGEVLAEDGRVREEKGQKARAFVLTHKNYLEQSKRILAFLRNMGRSGS